MGLNLPAESSPGASAGVWSSDTLAGEGGHAAQGGLLPEVMNECALRWEGEIEMLAAIQSIDTIYYL